MRKKSKKTIEREKLNEWKKKVHERDDGKCQVCVSLGKAKDLGNHYQTHHIIPRQYIANKFHIDNGIILCYNHHKIGRNSAHNNALWFSEWLKNNKPFQYEYCMRELGISTLSITNH